MTWVQLGGSIGAILMLAGIAWMLGLGKVTPMTDAGEAIEIAESGLSGFEADRAWLSIEQDRAVIAGRDGSIALIRSHGAHYVVRRTIAPAFRRHDRAAGSRIEIESGERFWGPLAIDLASRSEADAVAQRLAGARALTGRSSRSNAPDSPADNAPWQVN